MLIIAILLPTRALCERILVIDEKAAPKAAEPFAAEQQFWYELGIVLDRREVLLSSPSNENFSTLSADEKFKTAAVMCGEQQANAALWLEKSDREIVGFGMVVNGAEGKLGRIVTFDTPMSTPGDIALIAKEILDHGHSFAEQAQAAEDGWIIVPSDEPTKQPPTLPEFPADIGTLRDTELPGERPEPIEQERQKFIGLDLHAGVSQGIASFSGPCTWVGSELEGLIRPSKYISTRAGFGAAAGPRLTQNGDRILGYRLQPHLGLGVPFLFGNVGIDLFLNLGLTYTDITVTSTGYEPEQTTWWAFSPGMGLRILAPSTRPVAFSFKLSFAFETNGKRIVKSTETTTEELMKSPLLFLNLAVGISFSHFRRLPAPPQ